MRNYFNDQDISDLQKSVLHTHQADQSLGWLLELYGLEYREGGVWLSVGRATESYGWKLHLSSIQIQSHSLLRCVLPILTQWNVPFKIARNLTVLGLLNEGALGHTQIGKFATIYPIDIKMATDLATVLVDATSEFVGPKIVTDRHLGSVVYSRYGAFSPAIRRNRLGLFEPADEADGHAAAYRVPYATPEGMTDPFSEFTTVVAIDDKSINGNEVRPIGPGYLITDVLSRHPKGSVYKAIDLRSRDSIRTVILKEGKTFCMSDINGRAMEERIFNQSHAHLQAATANIAPLSHPPFLHGGSFFLPLEFIPGNDLGSRPAVPFSKLSIAEQDVLLGTLISTARAIASLHAAGVIHRDLSMRNIRVGYDNNVYLLDLEISHVMLTSDVSTMGDATVSAPFMQGTPGFISPQQLSGAEASTADDIYSFGAVIICAITGLDPQRVIYAQSTMDQEARSHQIGELSGAPKELCQIVAAAVAINREDRPKIESIIDGLSMPRIKAQPIHLPDSANIQKQCTEVAEAGAKWLIEGAPRDEETGMWKSPDIEAGKHADINLIHAFKVYRSANVGVAGVIYMLAKLFRHGLSIPHLGREVEKGIDWLLSHQPTSDDQLTGLHFGETGVGLAIAEALAAGIIPYGDWTEAYYQEIFTAPIDWPDLTHGAAGQGLGALACADLLSSKTNIVQMSKSCVARCSEYLCQHQDRDGSWSLPNGVFEMSGKAYTGYAHGAAGALAFLTHPTVFENDGRVRDAAASAAQWLINHAQAGDRGLHIWWPMSPNEPRAWSWWCHGGPGIALAFLAYFRISRDARYAASARAALRAHPFEARQPNLSQCHGLAGIGEIYLDAYNVLGEDEWLDRAFNIGRLLINLAKRGDEGATWLVENPYVPTPDLMIGCSGVIHFLARLGLHQTSFGSPLSPCSYLSGTGSF